MLTHLQKNQFNEILEELGRNLDISETQYNAAVKSYEAVGLYLAKHDSPLGMYNPEILPQGSFMLGTMIQPIHEKDDLDIDLVCQLSNKPASWTQYSLKQVIGDHLKDHGTYKKMLKSPEGRRCWTLVYSDEANYHLDILPSIVDSGYRILLEKAFENFQQADTNTLALRITDRESDNYYTEQHHLNWLKSNPFGYARWFFQQATLDLVKAQFMLEAIQPVPAYKKEKLPLQRVVQILKRHRDMMFDGNKEKPISIIITTLAGRAYQKETSIIDALLNVIEQIPRLVTEKYSTAHGKYIKWIENPVNPDENFADRWADNPNLQANFEKWIRQVRIDITEALNQTGLHRIQESFEKSIGSNVVRKTFSDIGDRARLLTQQGKNQLDVTTGISSLGTATIKRHDFFGEQD